VVQAINVLLWRVLFPGAQPGGRKLIADLMSGFIYLAALLAILAFTIPLVVTVALLSQNGLDPGVVFTSYLGALLLGMSMLAIGQWVSSVTANQVVALILSWFIIAALIVVGEAMVTFFAAGSLTPVLEYIGLNRHYVSMARGVIDTRDLLYYFSVIFLFLYLTTRAVESRKWS